MGKNSLLKLLVIQWAIGIGIGLAGLLILIWQDGWIALGVLLLLWGDNWTKGS